MHIDAGNFIQYGSNFTILSLVKNITYFCTNFFTDNGGSHNPCEEVHSGTHATSEVETKNLQNFLCSHSNLIAYLNVHTYGQYWIYPWGYTPILPSDYRDLVKLSCYIPTIELYTGERERERERERELVFRFPHGLFCVIFID